MAESDLERTEPASGKRLAEAREKGQVPRSRELAIFASLMAGGGGLMMMGESLIDKLETLMRQGLTLNRALATQPEQLIPHLYAMSEAGLLLLVPFFVVMAVVSIASYLAMSGWLFSLEVFVPDFGRLNPIAGLGRLFSKSSLVDTVKAVLKSILVSGFAVWALWREFDAISSLPFEGVHAALAHVGHIIGMTYLIVAGSLAILVLIDVPWQLYDYAERMKMTKEEVRQESRETEGDPQIKGRIRRMQREAARRRMMSEVPKADVVITNPTRYAVALKYDASMRAPQVLASGHLLIAQTIRELAIEHHIPILEAPPLARALYHHASPGQEIPAALYGAVAQVLAWLFRVRESAAEGAPMPAAPEHLPVPAHLDPEAEH